MSKARTRKSDARQRIVETAERLFYAEGVRAVGIDRIIAESDVAKMTLYNHFGSKDDLILAVLEYREQQFDASLRRRIDRQLKKGLDPLAAFFAALKQWFESPGFRGCSFINAAVELADADHAASRFATEHKGRFRDRIEQIVADVGGTRAVSAAPAIALLVEGAIVTALLQRSSQAADVAEQAAIDLVARAKRK